MLRPSPRNRYGGDARHMDQSLLHTKRRQLDPATHVVIDYIEQSVLIAIGQDDARARERVRRDFGLTPGGAGLTGGFAAAAGATDACCAPDTRTAPV